MYVAVTSDAYLFMAVIIDPGVWIMLWRLNSTEVSTVSRSSEVLVSVVMSLLVLSCVD